MQIIPRTDGAGGTQPRRATALMTGGVMIALLALLVTACSGGGQDVQVTGKHGAAATGTLSPDGRTWHSQWALEVSQSYTVTAKASEQGGQPVTKTSAFKTLTPSQTFQTRIFQGYNQSYGVGMPVLLTFSQPITNKAAVERSLQ